MDPPPKKVRPLDPVERDNVLFFAALRGDPPPDALFLEECDDCEGHGTARCPECEGDGHVECTCRECDDVHETRCDTCRGKGHVGPCEACRGTGAVDSREGPAQPPVEAPVLPGLEAWT